MDIIEIISDEILTSLLKRSGNNNKKICLPIKLSLGNLDNKDDYQKPEIDEQLNFLYSNAEQQKDYSEKLNVIESLNDNQKIRIWSSHKDCDDYCLLLFICHNFKDKNISVVFSDEYNEYALNCNQLDISEINKLKLLEHNLTKEEIINYAKEWEQVLNENKEFRYIENGKIKSVDIDYFDNLILERLSKMGKVSISKFIGELLAYPVIKDVHFSIYNCLYLISALAHSNKIVKDNKDGQLFIYCK